MSPTTQEKRVATMDLTRAIDAATTAINLGDEQAMNAAANALTEARNAGTIQRWTMRPGTKTYRLCAVADDLLGRIGEAMRAAKEVRAALPKAAPSLRDVLVMRDEEKRSLSSRRTKARSDRARAMNAQVDGLGARELPSGSSKFRKFVWGARTFVLETVDEDDAGGIDGFEVWVLASETNLLGRTFANLRRILEGDTVDVAVAAMDERDELAHRLEEATLKLDALITDTERSGMLGRSAADKLRRGLVDTLGQRPAATLEAGR